MTRGLRRASAARGLGAAPSLGPRLIFQAKAEASVVPGAMAVPRRGLASCLLRGWSWSGRGVTYRYGCCASARGAGTAGGGATPTFQRPWVPRRGIGRGLPPLPHLAPVWTPGCKSGELRLQALWRGGRGGHRGHHDGQGTRIRAPGSGHGVRTQGQGTGSGRGVRAWGQGLRLLWRPHQVAWDAAAAAPSPLLLSAAYSSPCPLCGPGSWSPWAARVRKAVLRGTGRC